MSNKSREYQRYTTGAEDGMVYKVDGVKFDGFKDGVLIEAKGNYSNFVDSNGVFQEWFTGDQALIDQATRQLEAANGMPIQWHFHDSTSLNAIQKLLNNESILGIEFVLNPMP